ncbi:hypothetical protein [Streptomyces sp. NPDC010273]|uniref:hypothetical protein n=1 Tax=Streptomyces sp. NPDC010273 TaxID=3364829 RepID=UPI0036E0344F
MYFIPEGWNLSDTLSSLPASFGSTRPKVVRRLKRIEQAKKDSGGKIDHALDVVATLILETDDPDGVRDEVLQLLHQVQAGQATAGTPATVA